eukprot:SAG22_NODE_1546_length_4151_cov_6.763820_3_plen_61_part_00
MSDGEVTEAIQELRHRYKTGLTAKKARELLLTKRGFKVSEKRVKSVSPIHLLLVAARKFD